MEVSKKGIYFNRILCFIIVIGLLILSIILGITADITYHYNRYYNLSSTEYIKYIVLSFVVLVGDLVIAILKTKYELKRQKFLINIVNYIKFMTATNDYTLKSIADEFEESIEIVEDNIQKAIDRNILKNVYLSKKTKEILIINNLTDAKKIKANVQNVNVENNLILQDKGENKSN